MTVVTTIGHLGRLTGDSQMTTSTASVDQRLLRKVMLVALTGVAFVSLGARAHATESKPVEITITAPATKIVGYYEDLSPIQQITVTARVPFNSVVLTDQFRCRVVEGSCGSGCAPGLHECRPGASDRRRVRAERDQGHEAADRGGGGAGEGQRGRARILISRRRLNARRAAGPAAFLWQIAAIQRRFAGAA